MNARVCMTVTLLTIGALLSRLAHRYQQATDRYGRHFSPSRVRRDPASAPCAADTLVCTALTMPRSPTGSTSGRCSRNIRNISAVQRPMPFTCVSAAITSSSVSASSASRAASRPSIRRTGRACSGASAALRPTARSCSSGVAATAAGVGRPSNSASKRAVDRRRRLGRQLLRDDRVQQRLERIGVLRVGQPALAVPRIRSRITGSRRARYSSGLCVIRSRHPRQRSKGKGRAKVSG